MTDIPSDVCKRYGLSEAATVEDLEAALAECWATQATVDEAFGIASDKPTGGIAQADIYADEFNGRLLVLLREMDARAKAVYPDKAWDREFARIMSLHAGAMYRDHGGSGSGLHYMLWYCSPDELTAAFRELFEAEPKFEDAARDALF